MYSERGKLRGDVELIRTGLHDAVSLLPQITGDSRNIKRAVTDSGTDIRYDPVEKAGVSNLLEILSGVTRRPVDELAAEYDGHGYGTFKVAVAEAVVERLRPIRERFEELAAP